jgi:excinuclease ABC subunit A
MKTADWIIDFGPEGGDGQIVAAGTPEQIAATKGAIPGNFWSRRWPKGRRQSARIGLRRRSSALREPSCNG